VVVDGIARILVEALDEFRAKVSRSNADIVPSTAGSAGHRKQLPNDMERDPKQDRLIVDRPSMGGPSSQRLPVFLSGSADVGIIDEGEGDGFDGLNLDQTITDAVPTAGLHLGSLPESERDRYVTGQHGGSKLAAELHDLTLRACPCRS